MPDPFPITWHDLAERWTTPFTDEQRARLTVLPASADGIVQVYGIGPDAPDLILTTGYGYLDDMMGDCDAGDVWLVRFGQMRIEDFESLPEHPGW